VSRPPASRLRLAQPRTRRKRALALAQEEGPTITRCATMPGCRNGQRRDRIEYIGLIPARRGESASDPLFAGLIDPMESPPQQTAQRDRDAVEERLRKRIAAASRSRPRPPRARIQSDSHRVEHVLGHVGRCERDVEAGVGMRPINTRCGRPHATSWPDKCPSARRDSRAARVFSVAKVQWEPPRSRAEPAFALELFFFFLFSGNSAASAAARSRTTFNSWTLCAKCTVR